MTFPTKQLRLTKRLKNKNRAPIIPSGIQMMDCLVFTIQTGYS